MRKLGLANLRNLSKVTQLVKFTLAFLSPESELWKGKFYHYENLSFLRPHGHEYL